jgi:hypothetical protein
LQKLLQRRGAFSQASSAFSDGVGGPSFALDFDGKIDYGSDGAEAELKGHVAANAKDGD